jgi:hypothetical protein
MLHIDLLSLTHFFLWFFFGLFIKNEYKLVLILGVLWELFERLLISNKQIVNLLKKYWFVPYKYWYTNEKDIHKNISDLVINMIGYYIGNQIFL